MNDWDKLAEKFDTGSLEKASNISADNALIACPRIERVIKKHFINMKNLKALDFGCGTGYFCSKLKKMGFRTLGIDASKNMIKIAKKQFAGIFFLSGSAEKIKGRFDLISGIMVFQFIKNIENIFKKLIRHLNKNALFTFAVHNPDYVKKCLRDRVLFEDFASKKKPRIGFENFGSGKIPIFIRTLKEYDKLLKQFGLKRIFYSYPPFTKIFLKKHPRKPLPENVPEYLLAAYSKRD